MVVDLGYSKVSMKGRNFVAMSEVRYSPPLDREIVPIANYVEKLHLLVYPGDTYAKNPGWRGKKMPTLGKPGWCCILLDYTIQLPASLFYIPGNLSQPRYPPSASPLATKFLASGLTFLYSRSSTRD